MLELRRSYAAGLPYGWDRAIEPWELVDALDRNGFGRRAGATRFELRIRDVPVAITIDDLTGTCGANGRLAISMVVQLEGTEASDVRVAAGLLDDAHGQLSQLRAGDGFAGMPRNPFSSELEEVFGTIHRPTTETVTIELGEGLAFELRSDVGASTAVAAAVRALRSTAAGADGRQRAPELTAVRLRGRRLSISGAHREHAVVAVQALLEHRGEPAPRSVTSRAARWSRPPATYLRAWVGGILTVATLAWWIAPVGRNAMIAGALLVGAAVVTCEVVLRRRRVARRPGTGALVTGVALHVFTLAYGIVVLTSRGGITRGATTAEPDQMGELALASVGVATTAGPLGVELNAVSAQVIAHVELLFFLAVVARAVVIAGRRALAQLRPAPPQIGDDVVPAGRVRY